MNTRISLACSALIGLALAGGCGSEPEAPAGDAAAPAALTFSAAPIVGVQSQRCVDISGQSTANGAQAQLWDCNGGTNQSWTFDASQRLVVYGSKCLQPSGGASAAGTAAVIGDCADQAGQRWNVNADGTITNAQSGLCLDANGAGTANGTRLILWTCGTGANQRWTVSGAVSDAAVSLNAGGAASGAFAADAGFTGGSTYATTAAIDTSLVPAPAPPAAVFQTERYGEFTYTVGSRTPGSAQTVTLYFAESYWTAAGQRTFNVAINGATVLTAFDIFAAAGGARRAIARSFETAASASGQVVIQFARAGGPDNPKVSGITVTAGGTPPPPPPPPPPPAGQIQGVNWADQRDNFVNGVLYVSGLGASDTYASASTVASRVVGQLYAISGANTVRLPINEPTISSYWSTYTGAIDAALTQGRVILAYWAYTGGRPQNMTAFYAMWDRVVARYGGDANAYFEVINEPHGYGAADLTNLYNEWLNRYPSVPRGRVILDGAGLAQDATSVGRDARLNGTLIAVHDYSFFAGYESENEWANHIGGYIGAYASRVVVTEWGGPMGPGSKDGVSYDTIDYSIPSGSFFADYVRGVSSKLRSLGVGSVYWPGLRDGDWYSLARKTGTGANINLTLVNPSGLGRIQYAWGIGSGGGTYVRIRNTATGLYLDGMGSTSSGADAGQSSAATSTSTQWVIENLDNGVKIRNRATGLYLDGAGRTANGANVGQWSASTSAAQQWSVLTDANSVLVRNRATNLYLDGMGRTASGSLAGQYAGSASANQRWRIVAAE